jgi:hypothetical protein
MLQSAGTPLAALNKRQVSNGVAAGPSNSSRTYKVSNGVAAGPSNSSRTYNATAATLPAALNKGSHARGDIAEEETRSVASDRLHNNSIKLVTSTRMRSSPIFIDPNGSAGATNNSPHNIGRVAISTVRHAVEGIYTWVELMLQSAGKSLAAVNKRFESVTV